ncbi:hypothetical protein Tdes44962_MAKER04818 [Teratosphaeria destructans]|uniref:Uncharacterized protein n=1 Tax=Teratosphaeria destructans TaxID=418781 RepID=A0A9W7VZE8_9PEZI|nr:hypothetical protein Tdes44962_MAKER04818 [Teratosphaeria destructans]
MASNLLTLTTFLLATATPFTLATSNLNPILAPRDFVCSGSNTSKRDNVTVHVDANQAGSAVRRVQGVRPAPSERPSLTP